MPTDRLDARDRLLTRAGYGGAEIKPLAADASFRRYDRISRTDGTRAVLMDAPPDKEDVRPFHRIAELLASWNLSSPQVFGADAASGYLLLEDMGDDLFSRLIESGHDESGLYRAAVDVLANVARHQPPPDIPAYDLDLLLSECDLFLQWRFPEATGRDASSIERETWRDAWSTVLADIAQVQNTLVLRDYHVDNLIWLPERPGLRKVGLLDFQDAVVGHPAYDLASLLSDVRRDVSTDVESAMLRHYLDATGQNETDLGSAYTVLAAQRNAKILGIFTRLSRRDGKDGYLKWLPRTWRLFRRDLSNPALAPVAHWLDNHLPRDPAER